MSIADTRFMKACRLELADTTPVWFMRQAGRMLPEYRKVREKYTLMEICRQPELCAEVTMQPVRRLGVDAAVMFADIMLPLGGIERGAGRGHGRGRDARADRHRGWRGTGRWCRPRRRTTDQERGRPGSAQANRA